MTDKQFNSWVRLINDRIQEVVDELETADPVDIEKISKKLKKLVSLLDESMKD